MTDKAPISVLIVEDSDTARSLLIEIVCSDPRLRLAGAVSSGNAALRQLSSLAPDTVIMDIELPGMDGIETTRQIMEARPTPILIVSAHTQTESVTRAMQSLEAGALGIMAKPLSEGFEGDAGFARLLTDQLVAICDLKLVRQRFSAAGRLPSDHAAAARQCIKPETGKPFGVGIVASTGGPGALVTILSKLPPDFPAPIFIVQHMGAQFVEGFAAWLSRLCSLPARMAISGEIPVEGHIYVAPGNSHLSIAEGRIKLGGTDLVDGHRPSGTVLLKSMARYWGDKAIGVLLTGMGEDGARGLAAMHAAGAWTIAQDESTSVVYGMPGIAADLGAASEILPLDMIASTLIRNSGCAGAHVSGDGATHTEPKRIA